MVAAVSSATTATQSKADVASSKLAQNMDTFLKMLTTQLKHQDPLSPMESNEFTSQLVQFASVEQSIASNKNLETLISMQQQVQLSNATGYVGQRIQAVTDGLPLQGGQAEAAYTTPQDTSKVNITITDATGSVVFTGTGDPGAGTHGFTWDGRANDGTAMPDGTYRIKVEAVSAKFDETGKAETAELETAVTGRVTSVGAADGQSMLFMNGVTVTLDKVISMQGNTVSKLSDAAGYIGKHIEGESPSIQLSDSEAKFSFEVPANMPQVKVVIRDSVGQIVNESVAAYSSGLQSYTWNGKDKQGNPMADGSYTATIQATSWDGKTQQSVLPLIQGDVTRVATKDNRVFLYLSNNTEIALDDVRYIGTSN
jgi:flagellar basal-body rod modification protein FlgD